MAGWLPRPARCRSRRFPNSVGALLRQAAAVRSGAATSADLVAVGLADAASSSVNAFTILLEDALDAARRADGVPRGERGPLHGVPVAVKDLFDVAGIATTSACAAYAGNIARTDAEAVRRLRAAGAIVIGKTNQHELAFGATSLISSFGPVRNPWDASRIAGGSSGGSAAAVAAGIVAGALGSDTGGSIRIPSSFCGATGVKPTHGAVSIRGAMPLNPWLDTAGPIAGDAADAALMLDVLAGFDVEDAWSVAGRFYEPLPLAGMRLAVPVQHPYEHMARHVRDAIERAADVLAALGAELVPPPPMPELEHSRESWVTVTLAEFGHIHADMRGRPDLDGFFGAMLEAAGRVSVDDYLAARDAIGGVRRAFRRAFADVDALLTPATVFPAPRADQETVMIDGTAIDVHVGGCARATFPANLAGIPAVAFPIGFSAERLPIGGQLMGPHWSERTLLHAVAAYQGETAWHAERPPKRA